MFAATLLIAEPATAAENVELIILSMADGNDVVYDAMASCVGAKGLEVYFEDGIVDIKAPGTVGGFGSDPDAWPDPLDSECLGYDLSEGQWYGKMAYFLVTCTDGSIWTFRRIVYRMGTEPDTKGIRKFYLDTVAHAYFRKVMYGDASTLPSGCLVRATSPAQADYTLCVIEARCKKPKK
ncbi:MAG: hypothetical protein HQ582_09670 [Planctomycetes bacterium]|nr:hypothetical protein [Planctomycetota bacterium]